MWPKTALTELLGIDVPIIQAPMAGASTPAMAAAAANAGGLGSLGCAMMTPEAYEAAFRQTRAATNRRINMNFFCHEPPGDDEQKAAKARALLKPFYDEHELGPVPDIRPTHFPYGAEMHDAVMATRPGVVSFHFGLPEQRFVAELKAYDTVILASATTPGEARYLEAHGVDAVIAQGWEAGGHHGFFQSAEGSGMGTMALVPALVDAVSVPVIAAGGIADGRGIAAALMLGADGVQIGTAFLTTAETMVPAAHQRALMVSDGSDTRPTRVFSGRPARGIINRYMEAMAGHEHDLPDFPLMNTVTQPLRKAGGAADSPDMLSLWSGQAVGLNRTGTTGELVERLVAETGEALARAAQSTSKR